MGRIGILCLFILIGIFSCQNDRCLSIDDEIEAIRQEYAPDKRTAIFEVHCNSGDQVVLSGQTNLPEAKSALISSLANKSLTIDDQIKLLPEDSDHANGVINVSVANLRGAPKHSAELVTQALLGTPVKILQKNGGWLRVQTPDQYIAWTNVSSLVQMTTEEFATWKAAEKVIYLETYGTAHAEDGIEVVSDLVSGSVLVLMNDSESHYNVQYPDGRTARIEHAKAWQLSEWQESIEVSASSITERSKELMGVPYLWGGTSSKGVDCSGFTKTVYLLHGFILPRDASQQVHSGILVDDSRDFSKLEIGDLLFFGRRNDDGSERVIHVGLWLGDNQFIHASGDVHISSMDSTSDNFDRYNYNRYLRSKRIFGADTGFNDLLTSSYTIN